MAQVSSMDYAIALPTFIGSLLSFLASATAIVFQIIRPPPKRHFRHFLITNLLIADVLYGLGNTISGAIFLAHGRTPNPSTPPDVACRVSGWVSQSNAQAVDFNILVISIVVLLSITRQNTVSRLDLKWQIILCAVAWIPGIITGTIGLALDSYGYVSGNWCWIKSQRLGLRYGLSHGPRIAIFFATVGIYSYVFVALKRIFRNIRSLSSISATRMTEPRAAAALETDDITHKILVTESVSVGHEMHNIPRLQDTRNHVSRLAATTTVYPTATIRGISNDGTSFKNSRMPAPPNLKKMLLLNGYPLAYIILWIPGIANRLAESVGSSPRWLKALQACTQYIGLINALTYGISEQIRRGAWKKLDGNSG